MKNVVAFDGEGIGSKYILLAASDGKQIHARRGLSARACLEFLTRPELRRSLNLWYSFNYDINMILKGVPDLDFWMGRRTLTLGDYEIRYTPSKILKIKVGRRTFTHYDVFGFFQTSFRQAIRQWLEIEEDALIEAGKAARGDFSAWTMEAIEAYNARELLHLKRLGEKLQEIFETLDLPLKMKSWHGAGAAAQAALATIHLDQELEGDPRVEEMARAAYYGGRVETLQRGVFQNVFHADLKSAYPSAALELPDLSKLTWRETRRLEPKSWGIYEIDFAGKLTDRLGALPVRLSNGLIVFPITGSGVYWQPEIFAAQRAGVQVDIKRGLAARRGPASRLRDLIEELYRLRTIYQRAGDGREKAVKLCLNALYGKLAQKTRGRYYSLALAGLITSITRARLFDALTQQPDAIIAAATDGIYSTHPLTLNVGKGLGQWEVDEWDYLKMIMNGVYLGCTSAGRIEARTRGFNLSYDQFAEVYAQICRTGSAEFHAQRFVTHSLHLLQTEAYPHVCEWVDTTRRINPHHDVKRCWPWAFDGSPQTSSPLPGPYASIPYQPKFEESLDTLFLDFDDL